MVVGGIFVGLVGVVAFSVYLPNYSAQALERRELVAQDAVSRERSKLVAGSTWKNMAKVRDAKAAAQPSGLATDDTHDSALR